MYLIIPAGKNSKNNLKIGALEMKVITLKRAWDNRYRKMFWITGLYLQYVETYNGYYLFTDRKKAKQFLRRIKG